MTEAVEKTYPVEIVYLDHTKMQIEFSHRGFARFCAAVVDGQPRYAHCDVVTGQLTYIRLADIRCIFSGQIGKVQE